MERQLEVTIARRELGRGVAINSDILIDGQRAANVWQARNPLRPTEDIGPPKIQIETNSWRAFLDGATLEEARVAYIALQEAIALAEKEDARQKVEGVGGLGEHDHNCFCGTTGRTPHITGEEGCTRSIVEAPIRVESGNYLVGGHEVTEFTLRQQRGYYQHPCGCWSCWPDSTNSINA